jgi:hypothetical protein
LAGPVEDYGIDLKQDGAACGNIRAKTFAVLGLQSI